MQSPAIASHDWNELSVTEFELFAKLALDEFLQLRKHLLLFGDEFGTLRSGHVFLPIGHLGDETLLFG